MHDEKIKALQQIREDSNENMLVVYNFKFDLTNLLRAFSFAEVLDKNDNSQIERWNKRQIKMLLLHPASAAYGLNLQKGGSMLVWYGLSWSLEHYAQMNARLYRQGQTECVRIIHIVAKNRLDEKVLRAIDDKHESQSGLLRFLQAYGGRENIGGEDYDGFG